MALLELVASLASYLGLAPSTIADEEERPYELDDCS